MAETIRIDDISLIKITKVKDWVIHFNCNDKHYILHGNSDCGEHSQTLFEKVYIGSKYQLEWMNSKPKNEWVKGSYIKTNDKTKKITVYSHIDKKYFAYMLTKNGFATGLFEERINLQNQEVEKIKKEIEKHEEEIRNLKLAIKEINKYI